MSGVFTVSAQPSELAPETSGKILLSNQASKPVESRPVRAEKPADPVRLMMYSHDSWGLGHLRRSLAIAGAATDHFENLNVLIVTGSPCATQFDLPDRVDVMKLPAVSKGSQGQYVSRRWPGKLAGTLEIRSRLISESFRAFEPHVIIVDHQLTGLYGEALPMLREAHAAGRYLIYGMRDVLDAPETVSAQWDSEAHRWALQEGFDLLCVYGSPDIFDPCSEYPELAQASDRIVFTGYMPSPPSTARWPAIPSLRQKVLVTMGGGEDGGDRIEAYLESLTLGIPEWNSLILAGPLMDAKLVRSIESSVEKRGLSDRVHVRHFSNDVLRHMRDADAVVSMAGYNSCAEIMQCRVPAVLLPRSWPRSEQLIRARRLAELGLAQCLEDYTPEAIRQALEHALTLGVVSGSHPPLNGLETICELFEPLFEGFAKRTTMQNSPDTVSGVV